MLRQLRVAKGMDVWDGFDSAPVTPLPPKFRMPDMERYRQRMSTYSFEDIQSVDEGHGFG